MSLKDAERNLKGMGKTIAQNSQGFKEAGRTVAGVGKLIASNTPGPAHLWQGAKETARGIWPIWLFILFIVLFGEPIAHWLTH